MRTAKHQACQKVYLYPSQVIPSPSDTFLQGQHSKCSRLAKAQLHVQADFSTDTRNTVQNVSKAASFHRGLGHLFSQPSKPARHLPALQHEISAMGHQDTRSISNAQNITPIPSQICFYLLNISSLCVQGFQLRSLRPVLYKSPHLHAIGSALGTCQKGVAGARLEPENGGNGRIVQVPAPLDQDRIGLQVQGNVSPEPQRAGHVWCGPPPEVEPLPQKLQQLGRC